MSGRRVSSGPARPAHRTIIVAGCVPRYVTVPCVPFLIFRWKRFKAGSAGYAHTLRIRPDPSWGGRMKDVFRGQRAAAAPVISAAEVVTTFAPATACRVADPFYAATATTSAPGPPPPSSARPAIWREAPQLDGSRSG